MKKLTHTKTITFIVHTINNNTSFKKINLLFKTCKANEMHIIVLKFLIRQTRNDIGPRVTVKGKVKVKGKVIMV